MDDQRCYIFQTSNTNGRFENVDLEHAYVEKRIRIYQEQWDKQRSRIEEILSSVHAKTAQEIVEFVSDPTDGSASRITTAVVLAGPGTASYNVVFEQVTGRIPDLEGSIFVQLSSTECPNLKAFLKTLICKATTSSIDSDKDDADRAPSKGRKLMNYDLQILHDALPSQFKGRIVVALQDSEAFDNGLLDDAISLLCSWLDRIPWVLILGIATSIGIFQEKLSRTASRCLAVRSFELVRSEEIVEQTMSVVASGNDVKLRLGPVLSSMLLQRHSDHLQDVLSFIDALQYAYMSHFYANPLSVILCDNFHDVTWTKELLEAVRNLTSFQRQAELLLDVGQTKAVRSLLTSDQYLTKFVGDGLQQSNQKLSSAVSAVRLFERLGRCISDLSPVPFSDLYVRAMAGELRQSTTIREFLLQAKKASTEVLLQLLDEIIGMADDAGLESKSFEANRHSLADLLAKSAETGGPSQSKRTRLSQTPRTTVVSQRVEFGQQDSLLSPCQTARAQIANDVVAHLEDYFSKTLINPRDLFLHEVLIYDLKSPYRDAFTPDPRFAIERALAAPRDYLGCTCCAGTGKTELAQGALSSTQPETAILYQMYLESGALINVLDLWYAFSTIVGQEERHEQRRLALFYKALAELKHLGMINSTRKKTDHVAKIAWRGI